MSTPPVELNQIRHVYGDRVALDGVSLTVEQPCVFGLLGPNGGGKTTLFKILSTIITPTSGTARILGEDVVAHRDQVRAQIGVVFQNPSLDVHLTVHENMMCQGNMYGLYGDGLKTRIHELLGRFGLQDRANERVKKLSGGQQRRIELAKSLLHRPQVLVLDEPSTGLDPGARAALSDFLAELRDKDGVTSLLTTHLIDEADRCDRLAIIDQGRIVAEGSPASLNALIGGDVITVRTKDPSGLASRIASRFSVKPEIEFGAVRIERNAGHQFVPELIEAFPGAVEGVFVGRPTLDDVFHHFTGRGLDDEVPANPAGAPSLQG